MAVSILSLYLKKGAPSTTEPFPCKRQKTAAAVFQRKKLRNTIARISYRLLIMYIFQIETFGLVHISRDSGWKFVFSHFDVRIQFHTLRFKAISFFIRSF
jgi:hypothetical protein